MTEPPQKPPTDKDRQRAEAGKRLAAALRDNLKRRKAAGRVAKPDAERN